MKWVATPLVAGNWLPRSVDSSAGEDVGAAEKGLRAAEGCAMASAYVRQARLINRELAHLVRSHRIFQP
jgi:hypothetical protein